MGRGDECWVVVEERRNCDLVGNMLCLKTGNPCDLVAIANLGSGCAVKTSDLEVGTSELDTVSTSAM